MSTTRRGFIVTSACATAAASLSACAGVATYHAQAPETGPVEVPRAEFDKIRLDRPSIRVLSPAFHEPVILIQVADGFRAIGATCSHQACAVRPGKSFLRCGCHGSTFTFDGDVVRGPAQMDLQRYDVTADDKTIRIDPRPV